MAWLTSRYFVSAKLMLSQRMGACSLFVKVANQQTSKNIYAAASSGFVQRRFSQDRASKTMARTEQTSKEPVAHRIKQNVPLKAQTKAFFNLPIEIRFEVYKYIPLPDKVVYHISNGTKAKRRYKWNWLDKVCVDTLCQRPHALSLDHLRNLTEDGKIAFLRLVKPQTQRIAVRYLHTPREFDDNLSNILWFMTTISLCHQLYRELAGECISNGVDHKVIFEGRYHPLTDIRWPLHPGHFSTISELEIEDRVEDEFVKEGGEDTMKRHGMCQMAPRMTSIQITLSSGVASSSSLGRSGWNTST
jgi:hypothetical protein